MNSPIICAISYFEKPNETNPYTEIINFAQQLALQNNWVYTHVGATIGFQGKQKDKTYKYTPRALEKIEEFLLEKEKSDFIATEVIQAGPNNDLNIGAIALVAITSPHAFNPYYCLKIIFDFNYFIKAARIKIGRQFLDLLIKEEKISTLKYALIHLMDREKGPGYYFSNLSVFGRLTEEEKLNLERWDKVHQIDNESYKRKIRDIYWGNLISEKHGGTYRKEILKIIENLIGKENVTQLDENRTFFTLPFDPFDTENYDHNLAEWRVRVKDALKQYDVFI